MGLAVVHTHHGRRPHKILQTPKRHLKIQNNICGRAVCIVCGPRPVYLNTTSQPMAVDRTQPHFVRSSSLCGRAVCFQYNRFNVPLNTLQDISGNHRLFVPKTFRSQERKVPMENFRPQGTKVPGTFVTRTFRSRELSFSRNESSRELSFPEPFVPGELSFPGPFVHRNFRSHICMRWFITAVQAQ